MSAVGLSWRWHAFRLTAAWPSRQVESVQAFGHALSAPCLCQQPCRHKWNRSTPPVFTTRAPVRASTAPLQVSATKGFPSASNSAADSRKASLAQPGQVVQLTCSSLAVGGQGLCQLEDGFVVFCDRALPGEVLQAQITKARKGHAFATKLRTLQPHADAVQPRCRHFGPCGGCTLQSLSPDAQLAAKQRQVAEVMTRIARLDNVDQVMRPIVACKDAFHYRNKMQFSFSGRIWQPEEAQHEAATSGSHMGTGQRVTDGQPPGDATSQTGDLAPQQHEPGGQPQHAQHTAQRQMPQQLALGLHRPGFYDEILPIQECWLQDPFANLIMNTALSSAQQAALQPFDPRNGLGFLQHLTIRKGRSALGSPHFMVVLDTARHDPKLLAPVVSALRRLNEPGMQGMHSSQPADVAQPVQATPASNQALGAQTLSTSSAAAHAGAAITDAAAAGTTTIRASSQTDCYQQACISSDPRIVSIVNNVRKPLQKRANGGMELRQPVTHMLWGAGHISERLCGLDFDLSATSFFQTNTAQAEVLYGMVAQAAGLRLDRSDTVLDLYCGTGTIGLSLAQRCKRVIGVEVSAAAVADARRNAERNGIANAQFVQGDVSVVASANADLLAKPDVIVTDPARAGMEPRVVSYLVHSGARTIVYVSCNPATQARDIAALCCQPDSRYAVASIQPCDMFPHTAHVECIAVLQMNY